MNTRATHESYLLQLSMKVLCVFALDSLFTLQCRMLATELCDGIVQFVAGLRV